MSYTANFETAKIYVSTGLKARAKEYLVKVVDAVPENERTADNTVYLKALVLLARFALEESDRGGSASYIDMGLAVKADHADLLFLKALVFWDIQRHDDMFLSLMGYLSAIVSHDSTRFEYEYAGERVVAEAIYKLLPEAFAKSAARDQLAAAIAEMAARTDNAMIITVHNVLQRMDSHGQGNQAASADLPTPR